MHLKKKQSRCRTAASKKKNVSNSFTVISQKFLPLYFSSEALEVWKYWNSIEKYFYKWKREINQDIVEKAWLFSNFLETIQKSSVSIGHLLIKFYTEFKMIYFQKNLTIISKIFFSNPNIIQSVIPFLIPQSFSPIKRKILNIATKKAE